MKTWNVFRAENRANGKECFLGTVDAETESQALYEAEGQYDCPKTASLRVEDINMTYQCDSAHCEHGTDTLHERGSGAYCRECSEQQRRYAAE